MPKKLIAQPRDNPVARSCVGGWPERATIPEHNKRITITVGEALHRKIKLTCVDRGINMVDALREAVERAPWPMAAEAATPRPARHPSGRSERGGMSDHG